jgi:hypothetical protein
MNGLTLDPGADAALAAGRWEPCPTFAADGPGSGVCTGCGWLLDDHPGDAVIRRLPRRAPRSLPSRRLAS